VLQGVLKVVDGHFELLGGELLGAELAAGVKNGDTARYRELRPLSTPPASLSLDLSAQLLREITVKTGVL